MIKDLVTIIIPAYNNEKTIIRAIESCVRQNYKELQILVIDNGSTDDTRQKVEKFSKGNPCVTYLYTSVKGRSHARNIGIHKARGAYVQFLDADDTLYKGAIKRGVLFLNENKRVFAYCEPVEYYNEETKRTNSALLDSDIEALKTHNIFPINSVLCRNQEIILFDESLDYCEDWLFWYENFSHRSVSIDNMHFKGCVFITGENSMRNIEFMARYRAVVKAKILKNIARRFGVKMSLFKIKLCLEFIWSYGEQKYSKDVLLNRNNELSLYLKIANLLLQWPLFRKKYLKHKSFQMDNNYYS